MTENDFARVLTRIEDYVATLDDALATEETPDETPFQILVSCVLSQRTKEEVTSAASRRLFAVAPDASRLDTLSEEEIGRLIYPVGFWRTKARHLRALSHALLERYGGEVPPDMEALLSLPGVGRKTANLVLAEGFGIPAICVDTHVHRITNRLGFVATSTPEETETQLRRRLDPALWRRINTPLVRFGRIVCTPQSPHCSTCPVRSSCARRGVRRAR